MMHHYTEWHLQMLPSVALLISTEEHTIGKQPMVASVNANVYSMLKCVIPALHIKVRNHVAYIDFAVHVLTLKVPVS